MMTMILNKLYLAYQELMEQIRTFVPDPTVVTYDPNAASNNYNPTNVLNELLAKEIKSDGTANFTGGSFSIGGGFGNLQTIDSSASVRSFQNLSC